MFDFRNGLLLLFGFVFVMLLFLLVVLLDGFGLLQDVFFLFGSFLLDILKLLQVICDEVEVFDFVVIDILVSELKDGFNCCLKCGVIDIWFKVGIDIFVCLYCCYEWYGVWVEEEFGLGEVIDQLCGMVIVFGVCNIDVDILVLMMFKCMGCGVEVMVNIESMMMVCCYWCCYVFGVNEQISNGVVFDVVLFFYIKKDDVVVCICQFVDKCCMFVLKVFKEQFILENVVGVFLFYMIVDSNVSVVVVGKGEIQIW